MGVHKYTQILAMVGDMGWYPSKILHSVSVLRFWNKLISLEENRITKTIFKRDFINNGKWRKSVQTILNSNDMEILYTNQLKCDINL